MLTTKQIRDLIREKKFDELKQRATKREIKTFLENEKRRKMYSKEGIKNLYAGICEKAVDDYKRAHKIAMLNRHRVLPKTHEETELEKFFNTEFFLNNSGMRNGEETIKQIEKTMIEEIEEK